MPGRAGRSRTNAESVCKWKWPSLAILLSRQSPCAVGYGFRYRQYSTGEPGTKCHLQPLLELPALFTCGKAMNTAQDFSQSDNAQKKDRILNLAQPLLNQGRRASFRHFRRNIGVEQKTGHSSGSRRGCLSRGNSISRSRNGDSANSCARLLLSVDRRESALPSCSSRRATAACTASSELAKRPSLTRLWMKASCRRLR